MKETENEEGHEPASGEGKETSSNALRLWSKCGDYILAAVFAMLIPMVVFLSIHFDFHGALAVSVNLACAILFFSLLAWFYNHGRPIRPVRIIESSAIFLVVFIIVIIAAPASWSVPKPSPGLAKRGACRDNLRTIDSANLQYEAAHGEGAYPATIEELVPSYIRQSPKEPAGGTYFLDTTTTPPHAACSEDHTY